MIFDIFKIVKPTKVFHEHLICISFQNCYSSLGCEVHYKRNVKKIAEKICRDESSQKVFKKIAYSIPGIVFSR